MVSVFWLCKCTVLPQYLTAVTIMFDHYVMYPLLVCILQQLIIYTLS